MDDSRKLLNEAKRYVKDFRMSLVSRTDPAQVSLTAKIPYKALQIREALLYRATDFGRCILRAGRYAELSIRGLHNQGISGNCRDAILH